MRVMKRNNERRIFKFFLVGIFALTITASINIRNASAKTIDPNNISIDFENQKLEVTSDDMQIYFGVPAIKAYKVKNEQGVTEVKKQVITSAWDAYDCAGAKVQIDLSFLNRNADAYIQLKGDKNQDIITIKIPAVLRKVASKYDAQTGKIIMNDMTVSKAPVALQGVTLEYRNRYSGWKDYTASTDLYSYEMRGTTLYVRVKASESQVLNTVSKQTTSMMDYKKEVLSIYEVGSFPGIETKMAIRKRAGAPKISADYSKQTIKLPKNMEYRVVTASKIGAWKQTGSEGYTYVSLSDLSKDMAGSSSASFQTRTVCTATMPSSREFLLDVSSPEELFLYEYDTTFKKIPESTTRGITDDIFIGDSVNEEAVVLGYKYDSKTKAFKGIIAENISLNPYEIYISRDGVAPTAESTGWISVAATKSEGKPVITSISNSSVKNSDIVYIRKKANATQKNWSSKIICAGVVKY